MSQNIFDTSSMMGPVRLRAGWDVPLQELYCNVELLRPPGELPEDAPRCFFEFVYPDVRALKTALAEAGIHIPEPMVEAVEKDALEKAGNIVREFNNQ